MKKFFATWLLMAIATFLFAQTKVDNIINAKEVERIERVLASDEMKGRRVFSPEIDKAADFIAVEFKAAGLETWNNGGTYRQEFSVINPRFLGASGTVNGVQIDVRNIAAVTHQPTVTINEQSGYEKATIAAGANLFNEAQKLVRSGKN
jgi:hypothetical protein